ncbi:BAH_G0004830.mRNA.1.CDS.1 [Saccharomyces cerevisiae]|nr:BAH_G0004830.mRNA.1.CDS.1 [Saccharomyces cerevisiae]CAI7052280.1 BAH_G0004830.mRNA.1.CDS.1 [Saccharomyces cerevisiae]
MTNRPKNPRQHENGLDGSCWKQLPVSLENAPLVKRSQDIKEQENVYSVTGIGSALMQTWMPYY